VTVVVLGDVMADVVALASGPLARGSDTPARVRFEGGGSAANVAAWLGALGAHAAFVGRVGDDAAGREAVARLAALGVDVRAEVDAERPTGSCVVLVEPGGERSMLPDPGANDAPARLPEDLARAGSHLHVSGYALLRTGSRPGALDALARAAAAGMTTSLDVSSAALLAPGRFDGVRVDLLRANAEEAAALTGEAEPVAAARALGSLAGEVVVTVGPGGALWTDGTAVERAAAVPADVLDTTGAGDAFTAGLLSARADGAAPAAALEAGCAAAARAVARSGARPTSA
jgi:sugar/nucleoside kinase (ribokinase family)